MRWPCDNTFVRDLGWLGVRVDPVPVRAPELLALDDGLAVELGLDPEELRSPEGVAVLAGNAIADGCEPIAQAYAGHQFGSYSPRLGDGRALLMGELVDLDGRLVDLHLKGSGRTPFARGGDGSAAVGPMLREYVVSEALHALGREPPAARVLGLTREERGVHALTLQPQHHHGVRGLGQHGVQVVADLARPVVHGHGDQGGRGHERDACAQGREQPHVGADHAGVQHVPHDHHVHPLEVHPGARHARGPRAHAAQGHGVEQGLGGVRVLAVPGVDHRGVDPPGVRELLRGAGGRVTDHHGVRAHGHERLCGVLERLALGHRGALGGEVDHVRAEPFGRGLERDPRARGVLEEQVDHGAPTQGGQFLDRARGHGGHLVRGVQDPHCLGVAQLVGRQQVLHTRGPFPAVPGARATSSSETTGESMITQSS